MSSGALRTCPFCKERIRKEAVKCRFCGEWLEQPPSPRTTPTPHTDSSTPSDSKSQTLTADEQNQDSTNKSVSVANADTPPLPEPPKLTTQDNYWDGYVYAIFCAYVTYCCITHLLGTISRPPLPGDAYAQGKFWGGLVLWLLATAAFSYATYQLVTRQATLLLIYSLVTLHGINVLARGIYPNELFLWITLSVLVITRFRKREMTRADDRSEDAGYELLRTATEWETKGRVQDALAAYKQVAETYSGTAVGLDAEKSAEALRRKIL